ncbi:MAG: carbohydrate kinase, partial [Armatimonadetes bacterium]|nr:carbohydrate kinase [Armatimonadota bacterium]
MDTTDSIDIARVDEILSRFNRLSIAVVGDFFLDKYMIVDPALSEVSIETGLEARQIVEIRCSPGAAGTVMNNLSALGVGELHAVGMTGDDGQGYELRRGLEFVGASTSHLISVADRFTPTYTK